MRDFACRQGYPGLKGEKGEKGESVSVRFVNTSRRAYVAFIGVAFRRAATSRSQTATIDLFLELFCNAHYLHIICIFIVWRYFFFRKYHVSAYRVCMHADNRESRRGDLAETDFIRRRINLSTVPLSKNNTSISITIVR